MWFANIFSWKLISPDSLLKKAKEKYNISWRFLLNIIFIPLSHVGFPRIRVWALWLIAEVLFRKPIWVWSRIKGKWPCETVVPGTAKPWPDSGRWVGHGDLWSTISTTEVSLPLLDAKGLASWFSRFVFGSGLPRWVSLIRRSRPHQLKATLGKEWHPWVWQEPTQQGRGSGQSGHSHRLWTSPLLPPLEHHYSSAPSTGSGTQ